MPICIPKIVPCAGIGMSLLKKYGEAVLMRARDRGGKLQPMRLTVEMEREDDGRWLAEIPQLPGVMSYGATVEEAARACRALALEVLAERLRAGEPIDSVQFIAA